MKLKNNVMKKIDEYNNALDLIKNWGIRKLAYDRAKMVVFDYEANNDYLTFIELISSGYRFGNLDEKLLYYRVHGKNDSLVEVQKIQTTQHLPRIYKQTTKQTSRKPHWLKLKQTQTKPHKPPLPTLKF